MFITYKNVVLLAKTVVKTVRTFPARIYRIFVLSDFWCSFIFCLGWKPVKGLVLLPAPPLPRFYDLFYMRPNPRRFFYISRFCLGKYQRGVREWKNPPEVKHISSFSRTEYYGNVLNLKIVKKHKDLNKNTSHVYMFMEDRSLVSWHLDTMRILLSLWLKKIYLTSLMKKTNNWTK